jgi:hypothetical protein
MVTLFRAKSVLHLLPSATGVYIFRQEYVPTDVLGGKYPFTNQPKSFRYKRPRHDSFFRLKL